MVVADYENMKQAESYGNTANQTMFVQSANLSGTMRATATSRAAYGATGQAMGFSDEDKAKARS